MTDTFTPLMRALVAASLLLATATLMLVTVNSARVRAAGALAVGKCGAFGEAFDFHSPGEARKSALAKCTADECRVVTTVQHGCAALAVDYADGCGARGWGQASDLGQAQNAALKSCYREGAKDCVSRTFFCDGKG